MEEFREMVGKRKGPPRGKAWEPVKCCSCGELTPIGRMSHRDYKPTDVCKACRAKNRQPGPRSRTEAQRVRERELYRLKGERLRAYNREWKAKNAHRVTDIKRVHRARANDITQRAVKAVGAARRAGILTKPSACERCGETARRIQAHHEDYSKPLDVIWLCLGCHKERHRKYNPLPLMREVQYVER